MELTRAEVDEMLRRADEVRGKLRRASRELKRFGEQAMAARDAERRGVVSEAERPSDDDCAGGDARRLTLSPNPLSSL